MTQPILHVALLAPLWYPVAADKGGVEQIVFLLARELLARRHQVTLIASGDSAPLGRLVTVYPEGMISAMEKGEVDEYSYYEAATLGEALRLAGSVDLIHSHLNCALVPFAPVLSVPVLHTIHVAMARDMVWLAGRFPLPPTNLLTTVSSHQEAALADLGNVTTVYNGIDMEAFPPCMAPEDYLLFLGRLEPYKGPAVAIEIAKTLRQPLILAGPAVNRPFFEKQIAPEIDGHLIRYVGPVQGTRKIELLRKAKGLLFPIQWDEPFGLVMIEAMACGTPVVALRRGAVPEVITPGINGFYGEQPADLPPLVKHLTEIDRAQVRSSVQERFSHRRMVDDYLVLYRHLLQQSAATSRAEDLEAVQFGKSA
jgi:glycosyltransferase involved in cell wall biosynthesis